MARNVSDARRNMMLEQPLLSIIPKLAIPTIIAQLVTAFYGLADTFFVSYLGDAATAAVGINDALAHLVQGVGMGFGAGAMSYIPRLLGAGKDREASLVASTVLGICVIFSLVFALVCLVFRETIVELQGAIETSKEYALDYMVYMLIGTPFVAGTFVLNHLLRAEGSNTLAMVGTVAGCIINIALDPLLIYTANLKVAGAAIATVISQIVSFFILLYPYIKRTTMVSLSVKLFKPKFKMLLEVVKNGMPTFLRTAIGSFASALTNNVAGQFGDYALAGMSVANKLMKFVESVTMGYANGIQPVVGFSWGAKKYHRVKHTYYTISGLGSAIALVLGIVASFFANELVSLFAKSPESLDMGVQVFRLQCYVLVPHMLVISASGFFQALGRAGTAMFLTCTRTLIVLAPVTVILPYFFGLDGLIWTRSASDLISLAISTPFVLKMLGEINRRIKDSEVQPQVQ